MSVCDFLLVINTDILSRIDRFEVVAIRKLLFKFWTLRFEPLGQRTLQLRPVGKLSGLPIRFN